MRSRSILVLTFILVATLVLTATGASGSDRPRFRAELDGASEVPPVETDTTGRFDIRFSRDLASADFDLVVRDGVAITQAHLHCAPEGVNGPIVAFLSGLVPGGFDVDGRLARFTLTDANVLPNDPEEAPACPAVINDLADIAEAAAEGLIYANVHSVANPAGEVRGQLEAR
jgi:hypothetical protein